MADTLNLEGLRTGAQAASENVAKFQEDIPGLLSGLKTNLTSIFAKDNPMMAQREGALQTFLNTPSSTRASLLPGNMPSVEGSPLTLSPTQQNAIVESRRNAALVPLAGLNQSIVGQYGNIGDILSAAAATYQSQLDAAKSRATSAAELYELAVKQDQFDRQLAMEKYKADKTSGSGMGNISSLIMSLLAGQQQERPPIESFDQDQPVYGPPEPESNPLQLSQNPFETAPANQPSLWDRFMGLFGATPKEEWQMPQPTPLAQSLSGLNFPTTLGLNQSGTGLYMAGR